MPELNLDHVQISDSVQMSQSRKVLCAHLTGETVNLTKLIRNTKQFHSRFRPIDLFTWFIGNS